MNRVEEKEGFEDAALIAQQVSVLFATAQLWYATTGRGIVVVDATLQLGKAFPALSYFGAAEVLHVGKAEMCRIVREYDPGCEVVVVLLKQANQMSTYTMTVLA
jgi:hypothetical protein